MCSLSFYYFKSTLPLPISKKQNIAGPGLQLHEHQLSRPGIWYGYSAALSSRRQRRSGRQWDANQGKPNESYIECFLALMVVVLVVGSCQLLWQLNYIYSYRFCVHCCCSTTPRSLLCMKLAVSFPVNKFNVFTLFSTRIYTALVLLD